MVIKNIIKTFLPSIIVGALLLVTAISPIVGAENSSIQAGADAAKGTDQTEDLFGEQGIFRTITNVLLFILGAVSVIMIIIGGLRYVISGGNSTNVTAAKNTILYAIVGVIIALLSYAIINFVLNSFTGSGGTGTNV